jgi:hypothetical protein
MSVVLDAIEVKKNDGVLDDETIAAVVGGYTAAMCRTTRCRRCSWRSSCAA